MHGFKTSAYKRGVLVIATLFLSGIFVLFSLLAVVYAASNDNATEMDRTLRLRLAEAGVTGLEPPPVMSAARVELGRMLFFDPVLSGNRDVSCATCHSPLFATADGLSLSIGVGGRGEGSERTLGVGRRRAPRNAPDVFNRGFTQWRSMFWDSRVAGSPETGFETPAGGALPEGLESLLAAQALFPPSSRDEMRGGIGDRDVLGQENELALYSDYDFAGIWQGLMQRLKAIPEYQELFASAYPGLEPGEIGIAQLANAIAAFQIDAWTFLDSPFDRYLAGDDAVLSAGAKRGTLLFYGEAGCAVCHAGNLLTDQQFHNLAAPPLGPGKAGGLLDYGRGMLTMRQEERFAFRTPPLRNVALTGPWLHNGAYTSLEGVIRQHLNPEAALRNYDTAQLEPDLRPTVRLEDEMIAVLLETLDPLMQKPLELSEQEIADLLSFLNALSSESAKDLSADIPKRVPSGLALGN